MLLRILIVILSVQIESNAQDWNSWVKITDDANHSIEYRYRLNPQTNNGNSFAIRIRNTTVDPVCGEIEIVLNMLKGRKNITQPFKCKGMEEVVCPTAYQFSDVLSFSGISSYKFNDCGESNNASKIVDATFTIDFHNDQSKQGIFKYIDPQGQFSFESKAYSGLQNASNNPYSQTFKDEGLIPAGIWNIELITEPRTVKERELNKYPPIFRLTPISGVELSSLKTDQFRNGFLIHSGKNPSTASQGCIILDNISRQKLKNALTKYRKIELRVKNKVY